MLQSMHCVIRVLLFVIMHNLKYKLCVVLLDQKVNDVYHTPGSNWHASTEPTLF